MDGTLKNKLNFKFLGFGHENFGVLEQIAERLGGTMETALNAT